MNKIINISLLILVISSCQIKLEEIQLYDTYDQPKQQEEIKPIIYSDAEGTMWNSLFNCGEFAISKETYFKGNASIKISWDKNLGCEWIGFGNSFNNWQASNINHYINSKALSFFVRTQIGEVSSIPIVASLEDFSGGGSYLFINCEKYLKGLTIDTTWKQIIVPLWDFPIKDEVENDDIDISSIKQLKFQLEGAGKFYIDEISLIEYSKKKYQAMQLEVENMKPKGLTNQIIYQEGKLKESGWGTGEKICHTLKETADAPGNRCIEWKYETNDCNWAQWGINWNDWYQINFRGLIDECSLELKIKTTPNAQFLLAIEDFKGNSSSIPIPSQNFSNWTTVKIPLSDFKLKENNFVLDQIKQISFKGIKSGKVLLDDIKIVLK